MKLVIGLSACAACGLAVTGAAAQEGDYDLGVIVLRGELQQRAIEDSPTSAAVVTGEAQEEAGDQDLYDTIQRVPGVVAAFGEKGFVIRGIDQRSSAGAGLTVTTQVDGIALPSNQATFFGPYSAWDMGQVEVLRGPQSTQQGRNALAGAVILRSNDPTYEREFKLRLGAGSRDFYQFAMVANTPVLDDRLAIRFSAVTQSEDGYVFGSTLGIDDFDPREFQEYRFKARWNPTDQFEAILSYGYTEHYGGEDVVDGTLFPAQRVNASDVPGREGSRHKNLSLRMNYSFDNGMVLESETNLYRHDYIRQEDFDFSPANYGARYADGYSDAFEQDLRLRFETEAMRGVLGFFATSIENDRPSTSFVDSGFAQGFPPNGFFVAVTNSFRVNIRNYAIFGEAEIDADRLLPGLSFTVGARYDLETFRFQEGTSFVPAVPPFMDTAYSGETTYRAFLPKFGVTYDFSDTQSVSLTYQRGYRAGGAQVNVLTNQLNEYEPEYTDNIELAYRGQFYDDRLRFNANLFYVKWKDQQVSQVGPSGNVLDTNIVNAGSSRLWGGELSVEGEPTDRLSLFGAAALSNTKYIDFPDPLGGPGFAGKEFAGASKVTASLGGRYQISDAWSVGVDANFTSGAFGDDANTPSLKSDDRWVVNAQLNYELDGLKAGVYVRNLLDEAYAVQRFGVSDLRSGEPRTVGFFVEKSF